MSDLFQGGAKVGPKTHRPSANLGVKKTPAFDVDALADLFGRNTAVAEAAVPAIAARRLQAPRKARGAPIQRLQQGVFKVGNKKATEARANAAINHFARYEADPEKYTFDDELGIQSLRDLKVAYDNKVGDLKALQERMKALKEEIATIALSYEKIQGEVTGAKPTDLPTRLTMSAVAEKMVEGGRRRSTRGKKH